MPLCYLIAAAVCLAIPQSSLHQQASKDVVIDPLSVTSLKLVILHDDMEIGVATGFVVDKNNKHYLVTNRHVVLACSLDQNPMNIGGWVCANKLRILHNRLNRLGEWLWVLEGLYDEKNNKRWFEHPTLGAGADLVALPLQKTENVHFYALDMELRKTDIQVGPADPVTIIGFPFGLVQQAGLGLPVWKTGTVASELDIDYQGKPIFLVDTTSRPGMSGSPVFAVRSGAFRSAEGTLKMQAGGAPIKKFLGVYSEQNQPAEIGGVWKADVLVALYNSL